MNDCFQQPFRCKYIGTRSQVISLWRKVLMVRRLILWLMLLTEYFLSGVKSWNILIESWQQLIRGLTDVRGQVLVVIILLFLLSLSGAGSAGHGVVRVAQLVVRGQGADSTHMSSTGLHSTAGWWSWSTLGLRALVTSVQVWVAAEIINTINN